MSDQLHLLNLFVSQDETREGIMSPFWKNGYAYATDGRIAVRMRCEQNPWPDDDIQRPNAEAIFVGFTTIGEPFNPPSYVAAITTCQSCLGLGERCCDMGHYHPCDFCEDGREYSWPEFEFNGRVFYGEHLTKLATLPGARVWVDSAQDNSKPCYVTWKHGDGFIMSIKKKEGAQ